MKFFENYIKNKNIAFFIATGIAIVSIVVAIVYSATWIKGYESILTLLMLIVGALAFLGISFVNANVGAAVMAGCDLLAFAVYVGKSYSYITSNFATGVDFGDTTIVKIVVLAVAMFVLFIISNVFVYLKMTKDVVTEENRNDK